MIFESLSQLVKDWHFVMAAEKAPKPAVSNRLGKKKINVLAVSVVVI